MNKLLPFIKRNLLFCIVAAFALTILLLWLLRPEPPRQFTPPATRISVAVQKVEHHSFDPLIKSYGLVEPRIRSKVVVQVSGRVVKINDQFRDGGFFKKNDVLLSIEKADYEIEADIARANLAEAQRQLQEEMAQAEQAKQDWARLGNNNEDASPLALREPQLESAKALVRSAAARVRQAELNLSRCDIRAPFDGRVLNKSVDLGQVVGMNNAIAEIYSTDAVEIRLPIKNEELPLLKLPEVYEDEAKSSDASTSVKIISDLAGREEWQGVITRTASSIDSESRQLYVVAVIDDPFGAKAKDRFPLKIGQYVTAEIQGRRIEQALAVPNRSIYQGSYVYVYREGKVFRKEINIGWQGENEALIASGLEDGEFLVLTPLGQVNSGTAVQASNAEALGIKESPTVAANDWQQKIPPERLEALKAEAKKQGISLEELLKKRRTERSGEKTP